MRQLNNASSVWFQMDQLCLKDDTFGIPQANKKAWSRGGFHKSWAQGVKRKAHPNLGENAISWA
jgi:hypothetical protein